MRSSIQLGEIISPAAVRCDVRAESKLEMLNELSNLVVSGHPSLGKVLNPSQICQLLLDREALAGTGIGHGVAIPHATSGRVTGFYCGFVRSVEPIEYDSVDNQPCRLFLVLLSPSAKPLFHIKALARVSRLLGDESVRAQLLEAPDAGVLHQVLCSLDSQRAGKRKVGLRR